MSDDEATVNVPVSLIERNTSAARGQDWVRKWNVAQEIHNLIPKPAAPRRLRVVDLDRDAVNIDTDHRGHVHHTFEDIESAPDVMTLIAQVQSDMENDEIACSATDEFARRIRTAIKEATR